MSAAMLTVLGSAGTRPGPGQACSSYLLTLDGYRLLLDCGNGSLSNLQRRHDVTDVDAVLISHLHPDHFADLYGLYYGLRFHPDGPRSVPVYAPPGARAFISQLLHGDSSDVFDEVCRFQEVRAGDTLELGPWTARLFAANHPVETLAPRLEADGTVLAYSGDSGPTSELDECARDADLFLCDATWLDRAGPYPEGVHMTGVEAGEQAARAGVARLLLTHLYPGTDPDEVAAEAAGAYAGQILVARDLEEFPL